MKAAPILFPPTPPTHPPTDALIAETRYDPLEIESNNRMYLSKGEVPASDALRQIAWSLGKPESKAAREEKPPAPAGFL